MRQSSFSQKYPIRLRKTTTDPLILAHILSIIRIIDVQNQKFVWQYWFEMATNKYQ
jgi:hypothetical protein